MRLLLVEDDPILGEGIKTAAEMAGHHVHWSLTLTDAGSYWQEDLVDGVLLDLNLPDGDGLTLLRSKRRQRDRTPCLILTARDAVEDRISGLDAGADDYLYKPFDNGEMLARLRAISRRQMDSGTARIEVGELVLETAACRVEYGGQLVALSRKEYLLLLELAKKPGRVNTRATLLDQLYGWEMEVESNTLEVHIHNLRKKLPGIPIQTVRGVGYRLSQAG